MGALHEGHASLVRRAVAENDVVVVSDFVNPTQFNDKNDLLKYPRTLDADCELLEKEGASFVFAPSVEEIYPEPDTRQFDYAPLDTVMEGKYRPGHFNGVCQIVSKLFMIVEPDKAYFGEKDFQQLAIIREMVKQMNFPLEIVGCPIVREADGLALSSRNARLSEEQRRQALGISQALFCSKEYAATHSVAETQEFVEKAIADAEGLELEYFELVDGLFPVAGQDADDNFGLAVEAAAGNELLPAVEDIDDSAVCADVVVPVNLVVENPELTGANILLLAAAEAYVGIGHGKHPFRLVVFLYGSTFLADHQGKEGKTHILIDFFWP